MKPLSVVLSIAVIAGGVFIAQSLIESAPEPQRTETELPRAPVEVMTARSGRARISVSGMGTVVPARQVELFAEVSGRVRAQFDGLREGAHVPRGTRLVRVDARDYKYAVDTARASLAQARARLEEERSRKEVAERDWALLEKSLGDSSMMPSAPAAEPTPADESSFNPGDMARRVPQIQSAQANLRSVNSQLKQAELQVGRTKLVAPFDAIVTRKNVEVGQLVGPTTSLATLVGTERFHIKVAVPVGSLPSIAIPGTNTGAAVGSKARVLQSVGEQTVAREGYVMFLLGELVEDGRMAQLMVAVDDPFELRVPPEQRGLPLLLGSYVRVEIEGNELLDVIELPRAVVHEDNTVWLVDAEQRLQFRPVTVRWRSRGRVFVSEGLEPGERVVTSRLAVPLANMPLRVTGDDPSEEPVADRAPAASPSAASPSAASPSAGAPTHSAAAPKAGA